MIYGNNKLIKRFSYFHTNDYPAIRDLIYFNRKINVVSAEEGRIIKEGRIGKYIDINFSIGCTCVVYTATHETTLKRIFLLLKLNMHLFIFIIIFTEMHIM